MKKNFIAIILLIAAIVQTHAMWENVKQQPYWHLQKIVHQGKEVVLTKPVGFILYHNNELHMQLAVNDCYCILETQDNGTITLVERKTVQENPLENSKLLAQEKLVKGLFLKVNNAKMLGKNLLLASPQVQFTFTPGEHPYMQAFQAKTWLFKGFIPTVSYGPPPMSPDEPMKLWSLGKLKILLTCGKPTYQQKTNMLHYPVSGTINGTPYTATITVNKNHNESQIHIEKIKVSGIWLRFTETQKQVYRQKNTFVSSFEKVHKIGSTKNQLWLHVPDGGHLIFQDSGQ